MFVNKSKFLLLFYFHATIKILKYQNSICVREGWGGRNILLCQNEFRLRNCLFNLLNKFYISRYEIETRLDRFGRSNVCAYMYNLNVFVINVPIDNVTRNPLGDRCVIINFNIVIFVSTF